MGKEADRTRVGELVCRNSVGLKVVEKRLLLLSRFDESPLDGSTIASAAEAEEKEVAIAATASRSFVVRVNVFLIVNVLELCHVQCSK